MLVINYTDVPRTKEEDINPKYTTWRDGKCISLNEGRYITLYIAHTEETVNDEEGNEQTVMKAFPIRMEHPMSRSKAINTAEMLAYGLRTPMDVASFNADLARKSREGVGSDEIAEHDEFIAWVKEELDKVGLRSTGASELELAKKRKIEQIIAYDKSPMVNLFNFHGIDMWLDRETRGGLMGRLNAERSMGHVQTNLWVGSVSMTLNIDDCYRFLYAVEVYAAQCYDTTEQHKSNVQNLTSVSEVNTYDYTTDYPAKLVLG